MLFLPPVPFKIGELLFFSDDDSDTLYRVMEIWRSEAERHIMGNPVFVIFVQSYNNDRNRTFYDSSALSQLVIKYTGQ